MDHALNQIKTHKQGLKYNKLMWMQNTSNIMSISMILTQWMKDKDLKTVEL